MIFFYIFHIIMNIFFKFYNRVFKNMFKFEPPDEG